MKTVGIITSYDGYNGKIVDNKRNVYELYKKNLLDETLKKGDIVEFENEEYKGVEVTKKLALFVKKYKGTK